MSKSKQSSEISSHSRSTHGPSKDHCLPDDDNFMNPQPLEQHDDYGHELEPEPYQQPPFYPDEHDDPILQKDPLPLEEEQDIWGAPTGGVEEQEVKHKPTQKKYYGKVQFGEELDDDYSYGPPDAKMKNSFRKKLSQFAFKEKITELLKYPEKQPIDLIVNTVCDALDFELHKGKVIGSLMVCNLKKMAMMDIKEDLEDIVESNKFLGSVGRSHDGLSMVCFWLIKKADLKKVLKKYSIFDSYMDNWKITETTRKKDIAKSMWQYWGDKVKAKEYSYFKLILL